MMRVVLTILLLLPAIAIAADWPTDLPREGVCAVCALRGSEHGNERLVAWREHSEEHYGFCSEACAEAFDQMPSGYAEPVLPRPGPAFSWTALNGKEIEPTGQTALLVDFWATWCAPCIQAMPELEQLAQDFAAEGLRVVGVSIDENRGDLDSFLDRRPLDYAVVHDGGEDPAWWQFRVPAIPAAFLLNDQGEIVAQWNGRIETKALRASVETLLGRE